MEHLGISSHMQTTDISLLPCHILGGLDQLVALAAQRAQERQPWEGEKPWGGDGPR